VASTYIEGCGHAAPLTHPDELVAIIQGFVAGLTR